MANELTRTAEIHATGATETSIALNGEIIDMASGGWTGVLILGHQNATQADAQLICQVGTASGSLSDTTGVVNGAAGRNLYLDINKPVARFVRGVWEAGSATIVYRSITTIPYKGRRGPSTQPAGTTGLRLYSPNTGTASG